jgi:hypothetical protein
MSTKVLSLLEVHQTEKARALHTKLAAVDITEVPVMSRERCIRRKDQAKLARELFKKFGLKGISVTAPNYSMAQSVDVTPPKRQDYELTDDGFIVASCEASKANQDARDRLGAILLAGFPSHDDRSEIQTDYFDYCWSIS